MEYMGNTYFNRKNLVVKAERRILKVSTKILVRFSRGNLVKILDNVRVVHSLFLSLLWKW